MTFIPVEAGTFTMGAPENEVGRSMSEEQHRVTLTEGYWLGQVEVTQEQYSCLAENTAHFRGPQRPMECVSWQEAFDFCRKMNECYGAQLPEGYRFALPSEAQWEYACRAGTTSAVYDGTELSAPNGANDALGALAWYGHNSGKETHDVGQKQPNAWGFHDMLGNAWEWCQDNCDLHKQTIRTDVPHGDQVNPLGRTGKGHITRGGGWGSQPSSCRAARRGVGGGHRHYDIGFRIAIIKK